MHRLLSAMIVFAGCAMASFAFAQSLPEDPEPLVQLLASKSRPPLVRRVSEEEKQLAVAIIELTEKGPAGDRRALTKKECEIIESFLGPDLLDHLRPNNLLAKQSPPPDGSVYKAIRALERLGLQAFPALVANCRDDRYSHVAVSSTMYRQTVGGTCMRIVADQVNPGHAYKGCSNYIGDEIHAYNIADWWKTRSSRSLSELRQEAMEWTLEKEKKEATHGGSFAREAARQRVASLSKERERTLGNKALQTDVLPE